MRLNISDLERLNLCGFLYKNKWDYRQTSVGSPSYIAGIKEVFRWHYNRSKPIEHDSFMTFLSNYHVRYNIDNETRIETEKAFRSFIETTFYKNVKNVYMNYSSDMKVSKEDYLEYTIPIYIENKEKPTFVFYNLGKHEESIFKQRYEVLYLSIWSFYYLNRVPVFINIYQNKDKIEYETIKVDEKYVMNAKKIMLTIGKNLKHFIIPPIQTCLSCSKIEECERFTTKKRGKNVKD